MNDNWFNIPVYNKKKAFLPYELNQLYDGFVDLKNKNILTNHNGTSLLSYNTNIKSVLDYFDLKHIKEKIRLYCNDYLINCGVKFNNVETREDWLIGYTKGEYQGEHNHGYDDRFISGIIYAKVPVGSSLIQFTTPNPYLNHTCIRYTQTISYTPEEGMIIIFPSFLKHNVLPNTNLSEESLRLCISFNAEIF